VQVTANNKNGRYGRFATALLIGTMLGGTPVLAQTAPAAQPEVPTLALQPPGGGTIRSLQVSGAQRLEADTVRSYIKLRAGERYDREALDQALKDLYATELFSDVQIRDDEGALTIQVRENPVINRIVLEGNKRIKNDKIMPEIRLAPRQIFTRSKARADVARIIELYRRQGRFAATVEPKMVQLDQNRVDVVFEISEGGKSKVRQINIIGNEKFSDGDLRGEMATKQARAFRLFSSGTSYDPDRLAFDQQKLRQFYLTEGYADFRVVSAVAELTPDKRDFIITYVVEEGERYKLGDVNVESEIRDIKPEILKPLVPMEKGDWYNAKMIEDTVDRITETTGLLGFTPDVSPDFVRDKDSLTMSITFRVRDAPRRYVESIDINGNTHTKDKVIRREFRLSEGDAFNSFRVKRSKERILSLGYFQDKFEIAEKPGSAPDRIVLEANVEERSTGELQVSAGFSSIERFIVNLSIRERNFMGKGQEVRASVDYSSYSRSVEVGFTEPYLFDRNIAVGADIFRRDFNSFNFTQNNDRNTTYEQTSTGFQIRAGLGLTEYTSLALRYGLTFDDVTLDRNTYYTLDNQGREFCQPLLAGRYLCDAVGKRTISSIGYSIVFDNLNNRLRPSAGQRLVFSQDFAGVGGSVKYIRSRVDGAKFFGIGGGFIFSVSGQGGYIHALGGRRTNDQGDEIEKIRLTDRFFLGEPQLRGFGIRGVGPRVIRARYDANNTLVGYDPATGKITNRRDLFSDDALGGRAYYMARAELEVPLGSGARDLGLRPSIYADIGALFGLRNPLRGQQSDFPNGVDLPQRDAAGNQLYTYTTTNPDQTVTQVTNTTICPSPTPAPNTTCVTTVQPIAPFREIYLGNTPKPRLAVGFGVNWNSPFGPFRIDIAKALITQKGDDPKLITFNIGTQF
jgi:outer membrane protein insertion porin family